MTSFTAASLSTDRLVDLAVSGKDQAFEQLFERDRMHLRQYVELPLDVEMRRRVDSSDAVQETFIAAHRRIADPAHHHHVRLWRSLPDVESELGTVFKAEHDPREPVYWDGMLKRDEARLTHRIKTLYGFYTIRQFIEDNVKRKKAEDAFLYLKA